MSSFIEKRSQDTQIISLKTAIRNIFNDLVSLRHKIQDYEEASQARDHTQDRMQSSEKYNDQIKQEFEREVNRYLSVMIEYRHERLSTDSMRVTVEFNGMKTRFFIDKETSFQHLSLKASNFWGINDKLIFFAHEGDRVVCSPETIVLSDFSNWGDSVPMDWEPTYHLMLQGDVVVEDIFEGLGEESRIILTEVASAPADEGKKKTYNQDVLHRRVRKNLIFTVVQLCFTFILFTIWAAILIQQDQLHRSSWMNDVLHQKLFENPSLHPFSLYEGNNDNNHIILPLDIWNYLQRLQSKLNFGGTEGPPEQLGISLYIYEALQLRQVRSIRKDCAGDYIDSNDCTTSYFDEPSTEDFGEGEAFEYDNEGWNAYIAGYLDYYPLSGFKVDLLTADQTQWNATIRDLKDQVWLNMQSRAVFIHQNVVNPTLELVSSFIFYAEISKDYAVSTNMSNHIISYSSIDPEFLVLQFSSLALILGLIYMECRLLLMSKSEVQQVYKVKVLKTLCSSQPEANLIESECQSLLQSWNQYTKKRFLWRLFKSRMSDRISVGSLILGFILQIAHGSISARLKASLSVKTEEYTDLHNELRIASVVVDLMLIVLIILGLRISRQLFLWLPTLLLYYEAWKEAIIDLLAVARTIAALLAGYILMHFYMIGPYFESYSRLDGAFIHTMNLILGGGEYGIGESYFVGNFSTAAQLLMVRTIGFVVVLLTCCLFLGSLGDLQCK